MSWAPPGTLGLGGAPLGNLFAPVTEADARATIDAAWDAGVRLFDTAPLYGAGLSERRFGDALRQRPRDEYAISTKVGRLLRPGSGGGQDAYQHALPFAVAFDYSGAGVRRSIEDSLQRLGLARIDMAFIHDPAEDTHGAGWRAMFDQAMAEAAPALEAMRAEGLIGAWGLGVNRVEPCLLALRQARPDAFLLAGRCTLLDQAALPELLPACAAAGVAVIAGGPFNSGLLAGGNTFEYVPAPDAMRARASRVAAVCAAYGVDVKAAALQFPGRQPAVAAVLAGARNPAEIAENARLMNAEVPDALWDALGHDAG